jgi:hypothetical protein
VVNRLETKNENGDIELIQPPEDPLDILNDDELFALNILVRTNLVVQPNQNPPQGYDYDNEVLKFTTGKVSLKKKVALSFVARNIS